jgi:hypothetical protein
MQDVSGGSAKNTFVNQALKAQALRGHVYQGRWALPVEPW